MAMLKFLTLFLFYFENRLWHVDWPSVLRNYKWNKRFDQSDKKNSTDSRLKFK